MVNEGLSFRFQRRLAAVAASLSLLLVLLVLQLVRWHVLAHPDTIPASVPVSLGEPQRARGNIVDRHGQLLATDVFRWDIGVSPNALKDADQEKLAQELAPLLKQSADELLAKIRAQPQAHYVLLASAVDQEVGERIASLLHPGVKAEPRPRRYYPQNELAAHLLGFVNVEGRAFYGVEEFYQEFLTNASTLYDSQGGDDTLPADFSPFIPSPVGRDLILTIDSGIQYLVQTELRRAIEYYGAQAGTIIVLDPRTGEILAAASEPTFDPNRYYEGNDRSWANSAISLAYEPGSVVKVVTLAAGLDAQAITLDETFRDNGRLEIGGYEIRNSDRRAHGIVTLTDILAQSLNVGAAQVSLKLGPEAFYRYLRDFGFGQVTEVDLAGESAGIVKNPNSPVWSESDLATNAYGQGLTVTPLQLATAVAAIANDGVLMKPHVVRATVDQGRLIPIRPKAQQRAVSAETARAVSQLMRDATARGIDADLVPGYQVAGKTGTAQVPTLTGYSEDTTIATYVAFLPVDDPRVVVLVKLDRPTRSTWAAEVTVPVFQRIAIELVRLLNIPPDTVRLSRK